MRISTSSVLLSTLTFFSSFPTLSTATPYARGSLLARYLDGSGLLAERGCPVPCGDGGAYCCTADQHCVVVGTIASCAPGVAAAAQSVVGGSSMQVGTTTWTGTETDLTTYTSTWTSYYANAATNVVSTVATPTASTCNYASEIACGATNCCILGQQTCNWNTNTCVNSNGASSGNPYYSPTLSPTYSAPVRGTSGVPYLTPVPTQPGAAGSTSGGHLSGGAIAGIVIGTLAGVFLLFLLCLCCCAGEALAAIFGRKKRRGSETIIETHETHHSHHGERPSGLAAWFGGGGRPSRPSNVYVEEEKKKTGIGLGTILAGLGALALAVGWKKKHDDKTTSYGSSYTYSTYSTESSSSSSSSDRTRTTRH